TMALSPNLIAALVGAGVFLVKLDEGLFVLVAHLIEAFEIVFAKALGDRLAVLGNDGIATALALDSVGGVEDRLLTFGRARDDFVA
ncbi:hypothetical protein ACC717_37515, partial [Rhizobium ruizarguesonis]